MVARAEMNDAGKMQVKEEVPWYEGLSEPHLGIAGSSARRIAVLAGPGTGKTSLGLMRRVMRLLQEGVPGERILLISFTRTAARDLRDKISELGVNGSDSVRATTLHSYCFELLQREAVLEITGRVPRTLLDHEVDIMLRDIGGDYGNIRERRALLKAYEAGWARGVEDHPGLAVIPNDREFERDLIYWLMHHRCMLIGEVIPIAYDFLRNNPANDEIKRYDHILVDEYQDLNTIEQQMVLLLSSDERASWIVAGDDDQSIYGFRYANPEGIQRVSADSNVQTFEIHRCGRSPKKIVSVANSLIRQAPGRDKPDLEATRTDNGSLSIIQWASLDDEVEGIAAAIASDIANERRSPGDILVLVNRQEIGNQLRKRLLSLEIPALSFFSQEPLKSDLSREALALLRMAVGDDATSLRVILGLGDNTARSSAYRQLQQLAQNSGKSEAALLAAESNGTKLPIRVPGLVKQYRLARAKIERLDVDDLESLVESLLPRDLEEVRDLRNLAEEHLPLATDAADLCAYIVSRVSQLDVPEAPDFVRIMSLHKSKGLTSLVVFVMSVLEGIIPTLSDSLTEAEQMKAIEEQRRLFYVAITRASEQLVVSSCRTMQTATAFNTRVRVSDNRNGYSRTISSRFLRELGPEAPMPVEGTTWLHSYS